MVGKCGESGNISMVLNFVTTLQFVMEFFGIFFLHTIGANSRACHSLHDNSAQYGHRSNFEKR